MRYDYRFGGAFRHGRSTLIQPKPRQSRRGPIDTSAITNIRLTVPPFSPTTPEKVRTMIAQPDFRPSPARPRPAAQAPARNPAQDADALLGALVHNWSLQRIALTLTLPAGQIAATDRLVARLRKAHELALQPLSLTVLVAEDAADTGLTARIRFDYAMTAERIRNYLAPQWQDAGVSVKADTTDRSARSFIITIA